MSISLVNDGAALVGHGASATYSLYGAGLVAKAVKDVSTNLFNEVYRYAFARDSFNQESLKLNDAKAVALDGAKNLGIGFVIRQVVSYVFPGSSSPLVKDALRFVGFAQVRSPVVNFAQNLVGSSVTLN